MLKKLYNDSTIKKYKKLASRILNYDLTKINSSSSESQPNKSINNSLTFISSSNL